MESLEQRVPLDIRIKSLFYPIVNYKKKYGDDSTLNESKGEIQKFNFIESQKYDVVIEHPSTVYRNSKGELDISPGFSYPVIRVGESVTALMWDDKGVEYGARWVHLGRDYFKLISKVKE